MKFRPDMARTIPSSRRNNQRTLLAVPWVQQAQWYNAAPESSPQLCHRLLSWDYFQALPEKVIWLLRRNKGIEYRVYIKGILKLVKQLLTLGDLENEPISQKVECFFNSLDMTEQETL